MHQQAEGYSKFCKFAHRQGGNPFTSFDELFLREVTPLLQEKGHLALPTVFDFILASKPMHVYQTEHIESGIYTYWSPLIYIE